MYSYWVDITDDDIEKERKRLDIEGFSKERLDQELESYGITKESKGVKKSVVRNNILFDDYVDILKQGKIHTIISGNYSLIRLILYHRGSIE
ncbi:hypothetical protein JTB14_002042 [Gonioctena quinquepunctata]|nr:hypothetical protein JTB14_002042 [Gonioctena quinquepunctata]